MTNHISRTELLRKLLSKDRPILLEALPEKYFAHAHIPGAINVPHDQVDHLAASALPRKDASVVVYCASATCQNSHLAALRLAELGYRDVQIYIEGKKDWIDAGLPVEGKG
ncbi:rhodanese-like domain-containing protein [Microvirga terrae]|uniref:Rhodanese-like domain-containing protein n=1 Tax=Microvirga terrae TaxID=2740529 RepID=A0ABY5RVG7_9HYPH|nr:MULTISPECIES: rhodanese-like domain-containing protein [Microvirga]MBQ0821618.1 rhodanese-like domain-containing protein [Microvirga sp. HBU67558]UVF21250.1 rhodanese-like domain-containing protein [Microvirga terrae]